MIITPKPLGGKILSREVLEKDKDACQKFGPCGVGREALYLGSRFIDRCFYIPWREVKRVFKRVAMSPGGFSGKGVFGSMAFLVVQYGSGKEKECPFKLEGDVDKLLAAVERAHPDIPTHSKAAEKKLAQAEEQERSRFLDELTGDAQAAVEEIQSAGKVLEARCSLSEALVSAAKQKRVVDNVKPWYRAVGVACAALGLALALWGVYALLTQSKNGALFLLGGGALLFFAITSDMIPSKWNSRKNAQADWDAAVAAMEKYLAGRAFPVPARYAHPVVLRRMIRAIREGKAETPEDALTVVKEELRALNSSVTVSQREHDEVVAVKPLFLVSDYQ